MKKAPQMLENTFLIFEVLFIFETDVNLQVYFGLYYLEIFPNSQKATALAAATFKESTP